MKTKITDFAFAGSGGALGASGFTGDGFRNVCACRSEASAKPPNPQQLSRRNSRRVRVSRACSRGASGCMEKRVEVEEREGELTQRLRSEKPEGKCPLF